MFQLFGTAAKSRLATQAAVHPLGTLHSAECARIHSAAFAHAWNSAELEALLSAPETLADGVVTGKSRSLLGFVLSRRAADEAEILSIAVDPGHRRRGIGRKLLLSHLGRLAGAGAQKLFLEVDSRNVAALGLYGSLGFVNVGTRRAYYRQTDGSFADALVLRCDLG